MEDDSRPNMSNRGLLSAGVQQTLQSSVGAAPFDAQSRHKRALKEAGIEFIDANGGGPDVGLRENKA